MPESISKTRGGLAWRERTIRAFTHEMQVTTKDTVGRRSGNKQVVAKSYFPYKFDDARTRSMFGYDIPSIIWEPIYQDGEMQTMREQYDRERHQHIYAGITDYTLQYRKRLLFRRLDALGRSEYWESLGIPIPTLRDSLSVAKEWFTVHLGELSRVRWTIPLVSPTEEGAVVCEWQIDGRRLSLYLSNGEQYFLRTWRFEGGNKMTLGRADQKKDMLAAWHWLWEGQSI